MPPYEGRQTQAKEGLDEHMDKVFHRVDEVPPGPGREISDAEREGVSSTDMDATSALRVDESISRRRGRRQAHQITQGGARQSPAKPPPATLQAPRTRRSPSWTATRSRCCQTG
jgi:hypothetical protein